MSEGQRRFNGRVALVTGSGRGIGLAIARRLGQEGAFVVINDLMPDEALAAVGRRLTSEAIDVRTVAGDIATDAVRQQMIEVAMDAWGHVDILVNNAYWEEVNGVDAISESGWRRTFEVSVTSALMMIQKILPAFRQQGHGAIVNVSSIHAWGASHRRVAYDTAKTALLAITRSVACDYGPEGVRCNAVCPGLILADRNRGWWTEVPARLDTVRWAYPARRAGTMEEVAAAVAFLASDDASFINGTSLMVDGGLSAMLAEVGLMDFARTEMPGL
ncbi:MAG: glucose 1-dehydrogenase [Firmicutes bacterium]|nr:glucose 1-dehydrogenase [Bacillota bacterium]